MFNSLLSKPMGVGGNAVRLSTAGHVSWMWGKELEMSRDV